ncbi:uncharacterized protein LOC108320098 [Vigna angularis]|uniref:uncharacterized protein LOC108320098 n=1 Tax=Phaseolus angularis TaxID=3914 RepID=UPI0022B2D522|nr:uncharacterized protein LOC108320098 [Vigna angularis]
MKGCDEVVTDLMIIEKIMRSMPLVFDHIVVAIEESRDLEKLKIEELQSSLEAYEMRMRERNLVKHNDRVLTVQHVKGEGKKKFKNWKGIQNKKVQNKKVQNKEAHMVKEESDSKPLILMVTTPSESYESLNKSWYLDSRCSNHMTYNREWLIDLDESKKSKVRVVDDNTLRVEGIINVIIKKKNEQHATIENILLVPEMKCNLLSIGQLIEKGFTMIMGNNDQVEVFDRSRKLILRSKIFKNCTFRVCKDMVEN